MRPILGWVALICHRGGTNLDRPANGVSTVGCQLSQFMEDWRSLARGVCDRSASETNFAPQLFLRDVTGEMRSLWTLRCCDV